MMLRSSLFMPLIFSVFLTACVPNATSYYRPSVDFKSYHEKAHCVPVEKFVHFTIEYEKGILEIRGSGSIYSTGKGKRASGQYVIEGKWAEIKYKDDNFYYSDANSTERLKAKEIFGKVYQYRDSKMFNSEAVFDNPSSDNFDVIFPKLIVDGEELSLPVLHVEKKIWMGISPFNC